MSATGEVGREALAAAAATHPAAVPAFTALVAQADADEDLNWAVSVDSTIVRAHQHAAGARNPSLPVPRMHALLDRCLNGAATSPSGGH